MREIAEEGRGVVVLIREPLTVMLAEQRRRAGEPIEPAGGELRDYGVGAQILIDLGVQRDGAADQQQEERRRPRRLRPEDRRPEAGSRPTGSRVRSMSTRTETPTARPAVDGVKGARILIVESRYYADIADALIEGAEREIGKNGATSERVDVPGAFEIPGAIALGRPRPTTTASWRWAASSAARPRITTMSAARARAG